MKYWQSSSHGSSPASKVAADQYKLLGLCATSLIIFISDHNLCQPVITTNASLTVVPVCTIDVNLPDIWTAAKFI